MKDLRCAQIGKILARHRDKKGSLKKIRLNIWNAAAWKSFENQSVRKKLVVKEERKKICTINSLWKFANCDRKDFRFKFHACRFDRMQFEGKEDHWKRFQRCFIRFASNHFHARSCFQFDSHRVILIPILSNLFLDNRILKISRKM